MVADVIQPSGRAVTRVWLGEAPDVRDEVATSLVARGGLLEWFSKNLLAVDTAKPDTTEAVRDDLAEVAGTGIQVQYGEQPQPSG